MDKYTAGKIEGMLVASRRFIEIAAEELSAATSGAKKIELGVKMGHAIADLIDVSREIYVEHPKLNPFLEMEKATAEYQDQLRRKSPKDSSLDMEFIGGAWRKKASRAKKASRTRR